MCGYSKSETAKLNNNRNLLKTFEVRVAFRKLSKAQNGTFFHCTFRESPIQYSNSVQFKYNKQ